MLDHRCGYDVSDVLGVVQGLAGDSDDAPVRDGRTAAVPGIDCRIYLDEQQIRPGVSIAIDGDPRDDARRHGDTVAALRKTVDVDSLLNAG